MRWDNKSRRSETGDLPSFRQHFMMDNVSISKKMNKQYSLTDSINYMRISHAISARRCVMISRDIWVVWVVTIATIKVSVNCRQSNSVTLKGLLRHMALPKNTPSITMRQVLTCKTKDFRVVPPYGIKCSKAWNKEFHPMEQSVPPYGTNTMMLMSHRRHAQPSDSQ